MSVEVQSDIQTRLRTFATAAIQSQGGLVEWPAQQNEGVAILDSQGADILGEEVVHLSLEPGNKGLWVNLAGEFLERFGQLVELQPRIAAMRAPPGYLKRSGLEDAVRHTFTWLNAKVKLGDSRPCPVPYHTWWLHAGFVSEDRWDTVISVSLNARTQLPLPLPEPTALWEIEPDESQDGPDLETLSAAAAVAQEQVVKKASEFIARMEARLVRDRKRLSDYYNALLREATHPKARQRTSPDPDKIEARKRAVQLELRRKLLELQERYAIRLALRPLAVVQTTVEVLAITLRVQRKQATRDHAIYWNPLLKTFEPFACTHCHCPTFAVSFSNETVAPHCANCATQGNNRSTSNESSTPPHPP